MPRRDQPVPLYYQVEVALRREIEAGEIPPGGRFPTEEELIDRFQVSRITIRSALRRLEEDGLIERHRGRGTFVRTDVADKIERDPGRLLGFEDDLRRQGVEPSIAVLSVEEIEPPERTARLLGLQPGDLACRVRRLGRANGQPLWVESRYYARDLGARMRAHGRLDGASLTTAIEEVLGTRVASARLRVEATAANAVQAQHLGVRVGAPLLVNQQVFCSPDGRTLEVVRAAFRADRYAFTFDLPQRPEPAWIEPSTVDQRWAVLTGRFQPGPVDTLDHSREGLPT